MRRRLVVVGAAGRMGRCIVSLVGESDRFELIAAIERQDHPDIGKDVGLIAGAGPMNVMLGSDFPVDADVAIDFSLPKAAEKTIDHCSENRVPLVLGTTGLSDEQKRNIKKASERIPLVYATNMSVGMNVLFSLVGKFAQMLGEDYDIEIIEKHHRFKKDAPSGTALTLAENICKATGRNSTQALSYGRHGKDAARQTSEIGIHAIRAGDITGVHSVIFGSLGETVTLNHTAHSRDTFVRGALRAAEWVVGKKPALYSMADVLGIK